MRLQGMWNSPEIQYNEVFRIRGEQRDIHSYPREKGLYRITVEYNNKICRGRIEGTSAKRNL